MKEHYWKYSLIILIIGLGFLLFRQAQPFMNGILGGFTLFLLLRNFTYWLQTKINKSLAVWLVTIGTTLFILVPLSLFGWAIVNQLTGVHFDPQAVIKPTKEVVEIIKEHTGFDLLSEGTFINVKEHFDEDEIPVVKQLNLMSTKPVIYAANVSEYDLKNGNAYTAQVQEYASKHNAEVVLISAKIEEELAELGEEEAKEYLAELGIEDSGINRMIKSVYHLLNLRTFITAGEKEVHAWTIPAGAKAPQAAGVIHTDFEKGFIRAEITPYDEFVACGSYAACKDKGVTRLEGKDYEVQDGDLVHFRFAV